MKKLFTLMLMSILSISVCGQNNAFPVRTTLENGVIEGNYDTHTGIQKYFGIPFAKPPVGELRWKAPEPLDSWEGIKITKAFGPRPMQAMVFGDMKSRSNGVSEDCLYLNVWTPAKRHDKKLPVLVYFYGGGNVAGDASEYRYDGEKMAQNGIVVVTANYRLNIFGNLAHPELSAEATYKASGNYGQLDQHMALKWVVENIAAFGGDPAQVTIAGESAGSIGVSVQMASPLSKNLIAGAIGESGAAIAPTMAPVPLVTAEKIGLEFVKNAGYEYFADFRNLTARDIYEIYNESKRFGFPMVIDGYLLPNSLPDIFTAKQQAQVPLLIGWNSAEIPGAAFTQGPVTKETFISKVKEAYPEKYEEVLLLYPHGNREELLWAATNLASDRFIVYSTWKWFDLHRTNSEQPVYRYLYSKKRPPLKDQNLVSGLAGGTVVRDSDAVPPPETLGAPHAAEIEYAMGNLHLVNDYAWTTDDYQTSGTMLAYFANFIKSGNPNGGELPQWNPAKGKNPMPPVMVIEPKSYLDQAKDDARFLFLDRDYRGMD